GINIIGHPDLRVLYLPTGFEGNPLRKDYPLVSRRVKPWPGIVDVEAMPGADDDADGEATDGEANE
ncbi:MAG TPA: NADH-quinone oxidoreductase subunit C, partial [Acidimicrobiaceae bacterium]|nr:NADH-quinone oxidoreductase subunit C [Acidimicrobiaceae bacterium]